MILTTNAITLRRHTSDEGEVLEDARFQLVLDLWQFPSEHVNCNLLAIENQLLELEPLLQCNSISNILIGLQSRQEDTEYSRVKLKAPSGKNNKGDILSEDIILLCHVN